MRMPTCYKDLRRFKMAQYAGLSRELKFCKVGIIYAMVY
jgi:hypothetical protein